MDSALPLINALGWTLLHFLWQGTAVAAALWLVLRAGRPLSARSRYLAATAALTAMLVWPVLTFLHQDRPALSVSRPAVAQAAAGNAAPVTPASLAARPQAAPAGPSAAPPPGNPVAPAAESPAHPTLANFSTRLQPAFPWIVSVWAAGVLFLSVRFLVGWRVVQRIRRSGTEPDPVWSARFETLRQRLRISRPVSLLVSASAAMPMVIGWVKPVVLVPAGLFLGLSAAQLEAILAHELAHIRRQDYLVNLCQAAVETVLFYHPAVWWVSARMREEREHCCDDIAAALTGSALAYARALTALEETRGLSSLPAGAVSAAGGSLLQRVQRLLGAAPRRPRAAAPWILGGLALLVAALAFSGVRQAHAGAPARDPDVKAWSTAGPGAWPMPGGVTLEVVCECVHPADILTTAVLTWPDGRRAVIPVAADAFANREPWALAWEAGRSEFWIAKGDLNAQGPSGTKGKAATIVRVDFSTPAGNGRRVVQTRYTGWPEDGPSPECRSTMEKRIDVPAKGEPGGEVIQWPTVNPPTMQANWLTVTVSIQADGRCVISQDDGGPWTPDQLEAPLRARAAAARATWQKIGDLTTPVEPHALLFVPAGTSPEAKQKVINACQAAGLAPADQSTGTAAQPDTTNRLHLVTTGSGFPGTEPEQHDLGEGTTIAFATRLYHGPNTDTRAIARWPARDGKPARYARFQVASDTMGHRQRWAAFWEDGQPVLWIAPAPLTADNTTPWQGGELHRFDLRDPDHIVGQIYNGFPAENGPSAALREKVASTLTFAADGEFLGHYRHWSVAGQNPPPVPSGQIFVFLRKDFRYQVGTQPECEVSALSGCLRKEIGEHEPPFEIAVHTPAGFPAAQEDAVVSALRDLQLVAATSSPPGPEEKEALAIQTALAFFASPDAAGKLKFVHHDDPSRRAAEEFFQRHPARAMTAGKLVDIPGHGPMLMAIGPRTVLGFDFPEGRQFITICEQDSAHWVSWNDTTLRQQAAYDDAAADQPEAPFALPAMVAPSDYYNYEFADGKRWRCFRLTCPGVEGRFFGYAAEGSAVLTQLTGPAPPGRNGVVEVTVKFPPGKRGRKQVEILSVKAPGSSQH